jgi:hypothetical protein
VDRWAELENGGELGNGAGDAAHAAQRTGKEADISSPEIPERILVILNHERQKYKRC